MILLCICLLSCVAAASVTIILAYVFSNPAFNPLDEEDTDDA
jgi:hypothetical protein